MDMKLESVSDLYLILSVLVPGFVYNGILAHFIPFRMSSEKALIVLRLLTATAVNYAICSPLLFALITGSVFPSRPWAQAAIWFVVLFVVPLVMGVVRAIIITNDIGFNLYRLIKVKPISPIPTGWDWIFSRVDPCYVLVTLKDGSRIAGYLGSSSMASSDPDRKDLYIEKLYTIPEDGSDWVEFAGTLGIHISGDQISYIEFRS